MAEKEIKFLPTYTQEGPVPSVKMPQNEMVTKYFHVGVIRLYYYKFSLPPVSKDTYTDLLRSILRHWWT